MRQRTGPVGRIGASGPRDGNPPTPSLRNPLWRLINPKPKPPGGATSSALRFAWATVTSAYPDPVQVQVDTETDPLPGVPAMLCVPDLGARVLLLQVGRRVIVLGVAQPDQSRRTSWQAGTVVVTPSAANTRTTAHVDFQAEFDEIPSVQVTPWSSVPDLVMVSFNNPTTDGVDIVMVRTDGAVATTVAWTATTKY